MEITNTNVTQNFGAMQLRKPKNVQKALSKAFEKLLYSDKPQAFQFQSTITVKDSTDPYVKYVRSLLQQTHRLGCEKIKTSNMKSKGRRTHNKSHSLIFMQ